jgi:hypothetical protein
MNGYLALLDEPSMKESLPEARQALIKNIRSIVCSEVNEWKKEIVKEEVNTAAKHNADCE